MRVPPKPTKRDFDHLGTVETSNLRHACTSGMCVQIHAMSTWMVCTHENVQKPAASSGKAVAHCCYLSRKACTSGGAHTDSPVLQTLARTTPSQPQKIQSQAIGLKDKPIRSLSSINGAFFVFVC
jgi:hypothetical protein